MEYLNLIILVFLVLILALFAIRFVSARMKKMQRKPKSSKFDTKYSKHWQRKH